MGVDWTAVVAGAVAAYLLGWLWYSEKMFGKKWAEGVGLVMTGSGGMGMAMVAQAVGTFLLAWVVGVLAVNDSLSLTILIAITIAVLIKAGGIWSQKSRYAIMVESTYVLAMVVVMVVAHVFL